nr:hypothetical protein CFP56_27267 [Quercus suber]
MRETKGLCPGEQEKPPKTDCSTCIKRPEHKKTEVEVKWTPMGPGMYKINFNGLKFEDQRASGIGVVMQDEIGFVIAALSKKLRGFVITALSKKLQDLRGTDEIETLVVETAVQLTWEVTVADLLACHARSVKNTLDTIMQLSRW